MLWDIIFYFFVKYVFGGVVGGVAYNGSLGTLFANGEMLNYDLGSANLGYVEINGMNGNSLYLTLGNYLSLIATIITIVAILLFCIFIIKKIIGVMFRLFSFGA